jgi:ComF family protein
LSNFLANAFDNVRRGALEAARLALPQRCELCASASAADLVCAECARALPTQRASCPVCALPTLSSMTCGRCLAHPPPFDATISAFVYAFPVDRLIHAFKYQGRLPLAEWCARSILAAREKRPASHVTRLIALPLSAERQRERGYNQATEIVRVIASQTGMGVVSRGIRRVRASPPQAALPWNERARNVRGAFECDVDLSGLAVAVIDDVMTTGASLAEFAKTLKGRGASRVENWVVARTLPPAA